MLIAKVAIKSKLLFYNGITLSKQNFFSTALAYMNLFEIFICSFQKCHIFVQFIYTRMKGLFFIIIQ